MEKLSYKRNIHIQQTSGRNHLFFQVTNYDVLIIEDLDRFNTSDIYLKLRELNQLINDSKEIGRHITFIYAVKDDVFKDSQRAKFLIIYLLLSL